MSAEQHPFAPEEVMAFLDGEVTGERTLAIAEHLEGCPECSALAGDFSSLGRHLEAWRVESSPAMPSFLTEAAISGVGNAKTLVGEAARQGRGAKFRFSGLLKLRGPMLQRPWVWALGGVFGGVLLAMSSFVMLRTPSAGSRGPAPELGQAPSSGLILPEKKSANSEDVKVDGMDSVDNAVNGIRSDNAQRRIESLPLNGRNYTEFELKDSRSELMIAKTASLSLTVKDIARARGSLEQIAKEHHGYFAELSTETQSGDGRSLTASLRVPASELDCVLSILRKLGAVLEDKQGGEEVSLRYVDLRARLINEQRTEKRLTDLLTKRTDKLKDVLDVERELASTREEIERMQALQRAMENQVSYASIAINLRQEYKPALNATPPAAGKRIRNASVEGYQAAAETALTLILFLLNNGPRIVLWILILLFPARWGWKRIRAATRIEPIAGAF
jgi:hypothetical protein